MEAFSTIIIQVTAFLVAITFHEFCHAATAYFLGDDTAKKMGRLTLNPLSHIDPLGLLLLFLIRIGWAKPVPFNPHNFSHPRLFSILVGLAGPASNLFLALISLILFHHLPYVPLLASFFKTSAWINVMLGVFNLIPVPPLDGSHIISSQLPARLVPAYARLQPFFFIALIIMISIPVFQKFLFSTIYAVLAVLDKISVSF